MPTRLHLVSLCCFFYHLKSLEPILRSFDFLFRYVSLGSFGAHQLFTPINLNSMPVQPVVALFRLLGKER